MPWKKGSTKKRNFQARELATRLDIDPLEVLLLIAGANWKRLGFKTGFRMIQGMDGKFRKVPVISISQRATASKEALNYIYPKVQPVQLDTNTGQKTFMDLAEELG